MSYSSDEDDDAEPDHLDFIEDEDDEDDDNENDESDEDKTDDSDDELGDLRDIVNIKTDNYKSDPRFGYNDESQKNIIEIVEEKEFETDDYINLFEFTTMLSYVKNLMSNPEYDEPIKKIIEEHKTNDHDIIAYNLIKGLHVNLVLYRKIGKKCEKISIDKLLLRPYEFYY
jgi:uncharacterized FlaG/YvyC family protein